MPPAKRPTDPRRARLVAIREATRLRQVDFVERLNAKARELFGELAGTYTQSALSKLEAGPNAITLDDIAVYAEVDPERRGKLWLAWNETKDLSMRAPKGAAIKKAPPGRMVLDGGTSTPVTAKKRSKSEQSA